MSASQPGWNATYTKSQQQTGADHREARQPDQLRGGSPSGFAAGAGGGSAG